MKRKKSFLNQKKLKAALVLIESSKFELKKAAFRLNDCFLRFVQLDRYELSPQ